MRSYYFRLVEEFFFENERTFIRWWRLRHSHGYRFSACIFCIWTWWRFRFIKFVLKSFEIAFRPSFSFRVLGETLDVFHPSGRRDSGNYTCVIFNGVTNTSASFLVTAQGKNCRPGFSFVIFFVFLYHEEERCLSSYF